MSVLFCSSGGLLTMGAWTESVDWQIDEGSWYRDVDWNTTTEDDDSDPPDTPGCQLYNFIMYAVLGGSICVLGCVGNILAFIVFWRDKIKTSTSLLFQVNIELLLLFYAVGCIEPRAKN